MKLSDIKTEKEFWEFSDIWYQRVHQLRAIWQNDNETTNERRLKAFILWQLMVNRVLKLSQIAIKFTQRSTPKFESGGVVGTIHN